METRGQGAGGTEVNGQIPLRNLKIEFWNPKIENFVDTLYFFLMKFFLAYERLV